MKDRAGNVLVPGDKVLYLEKGTSSSFLVWGIVEGFTPKMIIIKNVNGPDCTVRRHPYSVVKPYQEP